MNRARRPRLRRSQANRALDGAPSSSAELDALLRAATAPGTGAELQGEVAALENFREPKPTTVRRADRPGIGALLTNPRVLIGSLVLLLLVGGGVALAAGLGSGEQEPGPAVGAPGTETAPAEESTTPGSEGPQTVAGTLGLSFLGLCRSYQTDLADDPDAAANPAYEALTKDAGGQTKVRLYCNELLGEASEDPSAGPNPDAAVQAAEPTGPAAPAPVAIATPTSAPTQRPSAEPSQQPTSAPTPTTTATPTATATPSVRPTGKATKKP